MAILPRPDIYRGTADIRHACIKFAQERSFSEAIDGLALAARPSSETFSWESFCLSPADWFMVTAVWLVGYLVAVRIRRISSSTPASPCTTALNRIRINERGGGVAPFSG